MRISNCACGRGKEVKTRNTIKGAGLVALALLGGAGMFAYADNDNAQMTPVAISVPAGVIVPVALNDELSSNNSQVGQHFSVTVTTHQMGDSEFPPGTHLQGVIIEAQPKDKKNPGVLDMDFNMAILPNGGSVPIRGRLASLDSKDVHTTRHGRIVANSTSGDRSKAVGVGAGVGYVIGHVILGHNGLTSGIIGAIGGLIFNHNQHKSANVDLKPGTPIGVVLNDPVTYSDTSGYASYRGKYLEM